TAKRAEAADVTGTRAASRAAAAATAATAGAGMARAGSARAPAARAARAAAGHPHALGTFPADDLLPAGGLRGPAHRSRGRCLRQPGPVRPAAPPSRLRTRRRLHHGAVLR